MEWPMWEDKPLSFVGQFRMTEIVPFDADGDLPQAGILYFFYDAHQEAWGFDPADRGAWKVLHYDGPESALQPRRTPAGPDPSIAEIEFQECGIVFSLGISLPSWESPFITSLKFTETENDDYLALLEEIAALNGESSVWHHLLGHPQPVQGDMQLECQLAAHGLFCGDASGYEDPLRPHLEDGAKDWRLLLQIDSDDDPAMMWGDVGRIYYWIRQEDLRAKDFEKVWFVLQCG